MPLSTLVHQMAKNVRITKGNHNASYLLFAVNIPVWKKKRKKNWEEELSSQFFPKGAKGASVLHRPLTVSTRLSELRYGH